MLYSPASQTILRQSKSLKLPKKEKKQVNASTIGCVLAPAYPAGFFENPGTDEEYEYQNGDQWDWFAGRLILEEFLNGRNEDALIHLREVATQDNNLGGFYEWCTLNGTGKGSPTFFWEVLACLGSV